MFTVKLEMVFDIVKKGSISLANFMILFWDPIQKKLR